MFGNKTVIRSIKREDRVIAVLDHHKLHKFIIDRVSYEISNLIEDCYYPKIKSIYKELLHQCQTNEGLLRKYSKEKYDQPYKLLHDPYTTLMVLIVQDFLKNKDIAAAKATFHLFSIKTYTNLLYKFTTEKGGGKRNYCNPDYFKYAWNNLSQNHMFSKKKTISNSIIYYSDSMFRMYQKALENDDKAQLHKMIFALRTRMNQSMRSFFNKYYEAKDNQSAKTKDEEDYDESRDLKLRQFCDRIAKDICLYSKIDNNSVVTANNLVKFNKKLSKRYIDELSQQQYYDNVNLAIYLMLEFVIKSDNSIDVIKSHKFIDYIKKLLSIKVTKKPIYFKKVIEDIHAEVITNTDLLDWYADLSIQSKSISRNFIAYYLALYIRNYF